jgi:predicted transcriptional regulator with HTH domain
MVNIKGLIGGTPSNYITALKSIHDGKRYCRNIPLIAKGYLVIKHERGLYPIYHYSNPPQKIKNVLKVVMI